MSDYFLVCGLGSLGQHCVSALKQFQVPVIAIEKTINSLDWEIPELLELIDEIVEGDCRQIKILKSAKAEQCRAALIVTSNEKINAEAAIAIRQLNPKARLVVRSGKENLNILLQEKLGNFIAYEPTQLPATTFALAALDTETIGFFSLNNRKIKITKSQITPEHPWCNNRNLFSLNTTTRRLLTCMSSNSNRLTQDFHQWDPKRIIQAGDTVIYAEMVDSLVSHKQSSTVSRRSESDKLIYKFKSFINSLTPRFHNFWQLSFQQQVRRVALVSGFTVIILSIVGGILFDQYYPNTNFLSALYGTIVLLLGGYADLFGGLEPDETLPWWLKLFALSLTLTGTAFVGVLYALLTEGLLASKFELIKARPKPPQENHIIVIGLGRVGRKVVEILKDFRQPVVGVSFNSDFDQTFLPDMPLIIGSMNEALETANLKTSKSVIVTTDDEMVNLEIALMARAANPNNNLVIRTYGQDLTNNLNQLLPDAQVLGAYAVAAEAFAGAAFGENIISLFRLEHENILVTEYSIDPDDTLHGFLISEVAYGYGVEVISLLKPNQPINIMPSDDLKLETGDRLVVLATIEGLQRIEQGTRNLREKRYFVRVISVINKDALFEGANVLAKVSGCNLASARELMSNLPQTLDTPLYKFQAMRLIKELDKRLVKAELAFHQT